MSRRDDPIMMLKHLDMRFLFEYIGGLLVLRGILALILLYLGGESSTEPVYLNPQFSMAVYAGFIVGGFGLSKNKSWGIVLSEVVLFVAFVADIFSARPSWAIDGVGLILMVAIFGPLRKILFKD
ncbi:MAG: hypothetical protein V1875_03635 [Candidatus Altiarchaeota archaeon]